MASGRPIEDELLAAAVTLQSSADAAWDARSLLDVPEAAVGDDVKPFTVQRNLAPPRAVPGGPPGRCGQRPGASSHAVSSGCRPGRSMRITPSGRWPVAVRSSNRGRGVLRREV